MTSSKPEIAHPRRPDDAWWSEEDSEWVHGARDADGQLTGTIRYWGPDGVYISDCEHARGKPHGRARRFYADGSLAQECRYVDGRIDGVRAIYAPASADIEPPPQLVRVHTSVAVYECVYIDGDLCGTRFRDAEGVEVEPYRGTPVPERPPGVPETAGPFQRGWLYMRRRGESGDEVLETRIYFADGSLKEEKRPDGSNRNFHESGALCSEGRRVEHNGKRPQHGLWRYGDAGGNIRRESHYDHGSEQTRIWRRPAEEAGAGGAVECTGPIMSVDGLDGVECGLWTFRDPDGAVVREVNLGQAVSDDDLRAHPALAESADIDQLRAFAGREVQPGPGVCAALLRLAGRARSLAPLADSPLRDLADPAHPWVRLSRDGEVSDWHSGWNRRLVELMNALYLGTPSRAMAALAAHLFRNERAQAALDLIDAALLLADDDDLHEARVAYLRALGESEAVEQVLDRLEPGRVTAAEQALLLQIRAQPDDDGARLAYADHVAEMRPEHAALIRMDITDVDKDAPILGQLVQHLALELPEDMRDSFVGDGGGDHVERGFIAADSLRLEAEAFLGHSDGLFRLLPLADELTLYYASKRIPELATAPALRRYTGLSFVDTYLFNGGAGHLARSPHLEQLAHLGLRETNLYDEDLRAIVGSTAYPRLRSLDISNRREGQNYTYEGFTALADAPFAGHLERLAMDRRYFHDDVVAVLAALPKLHDLSMEGSDLGVGIMDLCDLDRRWTRLDLSRSGIDATCAQALAESDTMVELRALGLGSNPLGDDGVSALLSSPHLARVCNLDLSGGVRDGTRASAELGRALIDAPMASSLESVHLSLAALGPEGAVALARSPLVRLERLNLHNNGVGDEGAMAIARSPHLGALRHLDLSGNQVTDEGALALARSETLEKLTWLELGGAELSDGARQALTDRFGERAHFEYPWNRR